MPKILRVLGKTWIYGACAVISLSYAWIWYQNGFGALRELVSPFNFWNYIAVVITLAPGLLLQKSAGELEQGLNRKALWSLGAVFLSVVVVALLFKLAVIDNLETMKKSGGGQVRESGASSIRVKGKSATMYQHKNYIVTLVSGEVGSDGIPEIIKIDDVVTAKTFLGGKATFTARSSNLWITSLMLTNTSSETAYGSTSRTASLCNESSEKK